VGRVDDGVGAAFWVTVNKPWPVRFFSSRSRRWGMGGKFGFVGEMEPKIVGLPRTLAGGAADLPVYRVFDRLSIHLFLRGFRLIRRASLSIRDLYIYVSDLECEDPLHGANKALIGKTLIELKDTDGKLFMKELVTRRRPRPAESVDYKWTNPTSKKVEAKTVFYQK